MSEASTEAVEVEVSNVVYYGIIKDPVAGKNNRYWYKGCILGANCDVKALDLRRPNLVRVLACSFEDRQNLEEALEKLSNDEISISDFFTTDFFTTQGYLKIIPLKQIH